MESIMEIANLLVQVLEIIIWPFTILIIIYIFKEQILISFKSLSKLKFKEFEVEFDKNLKNAENLAERIQLPTSEEVITKLPQDPSTITDRLSQLAQVSPSAAILEAWKKVEFYIKESARINDIKIKGLIRERELFYNLIKAGKIPKETIDLYESLRKLRNKAVHGHDFVIDYEDTMRFIDLALRLVGELFKSIEN